MAVAARRKVEPEDIPTIDVQPYGPRVAGDMCQPTAQPATLSSPLGSPPVVSDIAVRLSGSDEQADQRAASPRFLKVGGIKEKVHQAKNIFLRENSSTSVRSWRGMSSAACRYLDLSDVNMIVIGCGDRVQHLVEKRLQYGLRTCVLWTDQFPFKVGDKHLGGMSNDQAIEEILRVDGGNNYVDFASFFERDFFWQPPPAGHPKIVIDKEGFGGLLKKFGGYLKRQQLDFVRFGPDLVELRPDQRYEILTTNRGERVEAAGVRVLNGLDGEEQSVAWQVSGELDFCCLPGIEDAKDEKPSFLKGSSTSQAKLSPKHDEESTVLETIESMWSTFRGGKERSRSSLDDGVESRKNFKADRNDDGAEVRSGNFLNHHLFYCGRQICFSVNDEYFEQCGPEEGPQCPSCERYQIRQDAMVNQEAKPVSLFFWDHLLVCAFLMFVAVTALVYGLCTSGCRNRGPTRDGHLSWERIPMLFVAAIFGMGTVPHMWGVSLTGQEPVANLRWIGLATCMISIATIAFVPGISLDKDKDAHWEFPLFHVGTLGTTLYLVLTLPIHVWFVRPQIRKELAGLHKPFDWRGHMFWFVSLVLSCLGPWIYCYVVAVTYLYLDSHNQAVLASVVLSVGTFLIETGCDLAICMVYHSYIYKPRATPVDSKVQALGDHRKHLAIPYLQVSSFCMGTQFVSYMAAAAKHPDHYSWAPSALSCLFVNVLNRTGIIKIMILRSLFKAKEEILQIQSATRISGKDSEAAAQKLGGLYSIMDNLVSLPQITFFLVWDVKTFSTYLKYVGAAALITGRFLAHGTGKHPIYNNNAMFALLMSIGCQFVEDLIVRAPSMVGFNWKWMEFLAPFYQDLHVFDPQQIFLKAKEDRNEEEPKINVKKLQPSLSLHGVRKISFLNTFFAVTAPVYFTAFGFTVLLGVGYAFGCCPEPISEGKQVQDALMWQIPRQCSHD